MTCNRRVHGANDVLLLCSHRMCCAVLNVTVMMCSRYANAEVALC